MSQIADFANTTQVNKSTQNEERELQHQKNKKNKKSYNTTQMWRMLNGLKYEKL